MLRNLYATPVIVGSTVTLGTAAVATTPFTNRFHDPLLSRWAHRVLSASGVRLSVEGAEHVSADRRYVFVANHQSLLDVPVLVVALPCRVRFVAKSSLAKVPVFGQALRALGNIPIDRKNRQETMRRLREAQQGVAQQFSLAFFAEGTRSEDGELLPFKKGGVAMALGLGVPIVPVAISGTLGVLPKGAHGIRRGGPVRVAVGEPIAVGPDTHEEKERLLALVRDEVATMYERIRIRD